MMVGILQVGIFLPECHSLKEKRAVLKGMKNRIRNMFNVSVAEVDYLDKWQRTTLAAAFVSNEKKHAEQTLEKLLKFIENDLRIEVIESLVEII
ncbi:DUF503 domain-containing protein [bacterium]|nr:DUF503 domain-containing protein [bacterium]